MLLAANVVAAQPAAPAVQPTPVVDTAPHAAPRLANTDDLDGWYLWLGPRVGALYRQQWDSNVGADLALLRVREHQGLAAYGVRFAATIPTATERTRFAFGAVVGTRRLANTMIGVTADATLELDPFARPAPGVSLGVWAHTGVVPFVAVGWTGGRQSSVTVEAGITIALPVMRRR